MAAEAMAWDLQQLAALLPAAGPTSVEAVLTVFSSLLTSPRWDARSHGQS